MEDRVEATLFVREQNYDWTIHSYCSRCFATVADTHSVDELEAAEEGHKCDPRLLELVQTYREVTLFDSAA
jgi:hypothetical protein